MFKWHNALSWRCSEPEERTDLMVRAKIKCTICHPALFAQNGRRTISPCDDHLREATTLARDSRDRLTEEEALCDALADMQYDAEWYGTPGLAEFFDRCEAAAWAEEDKRFMRGWGPSLSNYWCFEPHEMYGID